jgi:RNA polymerase sigma factor (sigma-70 family)
MDISAIKDELERHHRASYGWALSCCGRDQPEAEEALQIAYLKIFEGKARFRGESSFRTWLFAVIRKTAANERRRNFLRKLRLAANSESAERSRMDGPATAFEKSETQVRFQRALKALPARQRQALHLVFYQDLSLREAAEVMGVSIGSARTHYERGKKRLRESLGQTEFDYGTGWRGKENTGAVS